MGWARGGVKRTAADDWCSKAVRLAKNNRCEICGGPATEVMHVKGRRTRATRFAVDNLLSGCHTCHRKQEENPLEFADWFEAKFPGRKDRIHLKARGTLKKTKEIEAAISKHYREEYRRMEATGERDLQSWN